MVVGTPSYMAPEQATGKEVDHRSDIFSLGAVLYELFTGKKAFHADTVTAVLYKVVHEDPEPPATVNPSVPPGIDAAIRRALEKDPNLRFQSCVELRDTLRREAVLLRTASAKILAKPLLESGNHKRIAGARGKQRRALPVVLAAVIILAAAAIVVWPQRNKVPKLMQFISYLKHLGAQPRSGEATPPAPTTQAATTALPARANDATSNPPVAAPAAPASAEAATKTETQPQDSTPPSSQSVPAQLQPVPAQPAGDAAENKTASANVPARSTAGAQPSSAAAKDLKTDPEPAAATATADDQTTDRPTGEASTEPTDASNAPKHVRPSASPAPTVVEGFTRKDIPDLLRKADAAAGSGDYRSAIYEYDIVLRLDRVNARAREGLRRAREAEKERR
jgi:hypothetical protein